MEFPTISRSGITDDNSQLFPEIPTGVGTLQIIHNEHPIASLWKQDMAYILCIWSMVNFLLLQLTYFWLYPKADSQPIGDIVTK